MLRTWRSGRRAGASARRARFGHRALLPRSMPTVTSRAIRSPAASDRGGLRARSPPRPAMGASITGTTTAPSERSASTPCARHAATDGDTRHAAKCRPSRNAQRRLAERRRFVDAALARDHESAAARSFSSNPAASMTSSTPGRRANPPKRSCSARRANPTPPAAPAPGTSRSRRPVAVPGDPPTRVPRVERHDEVGRRALLRSVDRCGARSGPGADSTRRRRPRGAHRSDSLGCRAGPAAIRVRELMPRTPSAASVPRPPSVVALPPMPEHDPLGAGRDGGGEQLPGSRTSSRRPDRAAAARHATGPDASAISRAAVVPSADSSQRAVTGRPERVRDTSLVCQCHPPAAATPRACPRRRRRAAPGRCDRRVGHGASRAARASATSTAARTSP